MMLVVNRGMACCRSAYFSKLIAANACAFALIVHSVTLDKA